MAQVLPPDQMRVVYGRFYMHGARLFLDKRWVPAKLLSLLPYAEFWGVSDDRLREKLVRDAPAHVRENLKLVVTEFDDALDEWLAGRDEDSKCQSAEYVAFCAMRMGADFA